MLIVGQDKNMINRLKKDLNNKFAMKDLGPTQHMGINIMHDRKNKRFWLSQENILRKCMKGLI